MQSNLSSGPSVACAVRLATWVKRIGLGWHLDQIRKQRPEQRVNKSDQVDGMF